MMEIELQGGPFDGMKVNVSEFPPHAVLEVPIPPDFSRRPINDLTREEELKLEDIEKTFKRARYERQGGPGGRYVWDGN
jgi:hypothetical protein